MDFTSRKLPRLKNFDYSQNGYYFITICTKDMQCLLSSVVGNAAPSVPQVILTDYGKILESEILKMNNIYHNIQTTHYVIMPNHIHMIIEICESSGSETPETCTSISDYISTLKRFCSKKTGQKIWQKSFHDHIIRNEEDLYNHMQYINENPKKWIMGKDEYYV